MGLKEDSSNAKDGLPLCLDLSVTEHSVSVLYTNTVLTQYCVRTVFGLCSEQKTYYFFEHS